MAALTIHDVLRENAALKARVEELQDAIRHYRAQGVYRGRASRALFAVLPENLEGIPSPSNHDHVVPSADLE